MNIGITNIRSFKVDDGNGGKKDKAYLEMSIRPPHMESATYTITKNENKENDNAPDFYINYSFNKRGENYPRVRAGALWNKSSDGELEYKGGHIESPLFANGKMYIAVFEAKQREGFPPPTHRHDVAWSPPRQTQESSEYSQTNQTYQAPTQNQTQSYQPQAQTQSSQVPTIEIDEDEIPF